MKETSEPTPGPGGKAGVIGSVRNLFRSRRGRPPAGQDSRKRRLLVRGVKSLAILVSAWLLAAYVILPALWRHYEHHPALEDAPKTTVTAQGIPGDPLNVGLIGSEEALVHALLGSGWDPADPITLRSSLRIADSVLLDKPYADAPVSDLFLFGRKQDLAFEKPAGGSARRRHHVRFWRAVELGRGGVPLWIGAVTFDRSVGLSHRTGQITHHIGPDIDAERDGLIGDLVRAGMVTTRYQVSGVGPTVNGRNGEGDPYYTDGEIWVGALVVAGEKQTPPPTELTRPALVTAKDGIWNAVADTLRN
jgi:hypothetical protein